MITLIYILKLKKKRKKAIYIYIVKEIQILKIYI